ncbi:MAG: metal-dependent transcriptional regulator [Ferruginibacter sp.]|jgi:DtxR family Mn-dependent transcriptional regulator|nr:metal-dependent transcriptional regulator [Ferruginibacter sp.]
MNLTESEENYIKSIYHLHVPGQGVSATMLATSVQTKAASVTDMLKRLHRKKLINYKPYHNFSLTDLGSKIALEVIRKHRLWEFFLVGKLGFEWHEVHSIAEELEHISSRELIHRLDIFLGSPSFDPHGDPIPDRNGKIKTVRQTILSEIPEKKVVTVNAIADQSQTMHELLKHHHINIGTKIKINRHFSFDGSVEIKINKQPLTILSRQAAQNIFCII